MTRHAGYDLAAPTYLERHVLEKVRSAVARVGLVSTAGINEDADGGRLGSGLLRRDTHAVSQRVNLPGHARLLEAAKSALSYSSTHLRRRRPPVQVGVDRVVRRQRCKQGHAARAHGPRLHATPAGTQVTVCGRRNAKAGLRHQINKWPIGVFAASEELQRAKAGGRVTAGRGARAAMTHGPLKTSREHFDCFRGLPPTQNIQLKKKAL